VHRRLATLSAVLVVVAVGLAPAQAATKKAKPKPKPKPITGSYTLQLLPDPTAEVTMQVPGAVEGCGGVSPDGKDSRTIKLPAKGTLKIVLDSPDPTGSPSVGPVGGVGTDWDLYVREADGTIAASSHGATSHEETIEKLSRGTTRTIEVCNLIGQPDATVKWIFTYA
jgi:hypothetical protein